MKQEEARNETNHVRMVQIVVFRLGDEEYGLNIDQIKEVVLTPAITRVPQKPAFIKVFQTFAVISSRCLTWRKSLVFVKP